MNYTTIESAPRPTRKLYDLDPGFYEVEWGRTKRIIIIARSHPNDPSAWRQQTLTLDLDKGAIPFACWDQDKTAITVLRRLEPTNLTFREVTL